MIRLRYFYGILFVLILSGCVSSTSDAPVAENNSINKSESKVIGQTSLALNIDSSIDLLKHVKTVSVITPDGFEMELTDTVWLENIVNKFDRFSKIDPTYHSYAHTLLLRSESGNPVVMRIGNESIMIADQMYTSDLLAQLVLDVRGVIGNQLLADLSMEQITVFMLDVANHPLAFADEEVDQLREIIESATFIHERTEVTYPVYPHYVIQVFNGDKSVVHLDIIGNNIISIPYGKEHAFYYYLSENLYARFYSILPPFDFIDDHPKSLFRSSAVEIIHSNGEKVQYGKEGETTIIDDSITDSFARLLVGDGNKQIDLPKDQEEQLTLVFKGTDQQKVVKIYADGYLYKDRYYQSLNIEEKIVSHLNALKK